MQTKYPIVLAHGIALRDSGIMKAFRKISKLLRNAGYTVYPGNTDAFGSIENNASQLKASIEEILQKEQVDKVNIIAHSKGGLDAKCMIQQLNMADHVSSLTTLSTPHRGSGLASGIYRWPNWFKKFLVLWINLWYRICGDKHADALSVCRQLQLTPNEEIDYLTVTENVYCQSYSATMVRGRDDVMMSGPLAMSRRWDSGPTDGAVSNESAKYGEYRGEVISESLSHMQVIGWNLKKKNRQKVYDFYLTLCRELSERGL